MDLNHLKTSFYLDYYRIGTQSYRDKVRYYEANKDQLQFLDFNQQIEIKIDYILCLFEIGRYEYFLDKVDHIIELVVIENVFHYNGYDIYNELLFRKSACLYNTNKFNAAERILKALIKIDSDHINARNLYTICRRKHTSPQNQNVKAIAMVALLSGISIAFMELFIVKPFYAEYVKMFSTFKVWLFATALLILFGSELYFKYNIGRDIGFRFDFKSRLQAINKWYLRLTGGKIGNDPF